MAPIPEHELAAVNGMDGYEQLLEIDRPVSYTHLTLPTMIGV